MTSQFEDTTVDDLDVSNLSDGQLHDIADNDSRSTAQDKAKSELARREAASNAGPGGEDEENPDAGTLRTSAGEEYENESLEAGGGQVQHSVDVANEQGFWNGATEASPRGDEHTVAGVTRTPEETEE